MIKPVITVFPDRYVTGWNGEGLPETVYPTIDAIEALEATYDTDAHFSPYYVVNAEGVVEPSIPRLNKPAQAALEALGAKILFNTVWLDFDYDQAHKDGKPVPPAWREAQLERLGVLPIDISGAMGGYDTKGGYRLFAYLPEPLPIADYVPYVLALRAAILDGCGAEADPFKDWNRTYRLPRVRRALGRGYEVQAHACYWEGVGALQWVPTPASLTSAFAGIEKAHTAYKLPPVITANRNMELTRLAGKLRYAGLGYSEILAGLLSTVASGRCGDWEPKKGELEHIAEQIAKRPAGSKPVDPDPAVQAKVTEAAVEESRFTIGSDVELAREALVELETPLVPVVFDRARLWRYADVKGLWRNVPSHEVQNTVAAFDEAWISAGTYKDGSPKWRKLSLRQGQIAQIEERIGVSRTVPHWLDHAVEGLAFRDCFVKVQDDLITRVPHAPAHRATEGLPFDYAPNAQPALFLAFLRQMQENDEARVTLLREFIGVALLGLATRYQQAFMLVGGGSNGKSVFLDIVSALFGDPHLLANVESGAILDAGLITAVPPQEMDNEYRRDMLSGSRLNVCTEIESSEVLNGGAIKAIIDGSPIIGREIKQSPYRFRARCALAFACNLLPKLSDTSHGFFRRWQVVPWNVKIAEADADRTLAARIIKHELGLIASWAIDGAQATLDRGHYAKSAVCAETLAEWKQTADQVALFVAERCLEGDLAEKSKRTKAGDLYLAYTRWAPQNGKGQLSAVNFANRLKSLGFAKDRYSEGICYDIELLPVVFGIG